MSGGGGWPMDARGHPTGRGFLALPTLSRPASDEATGAEGPESPGQASDAFGAASAESPESPGRLTPDGRLLSLEGFSDWDPVEGREGLQVGTLQNAQNG